MADRDRPPALEMMATTHHVRKGAGWTGIGDVVIGGRTGNGSPDAISVVSYNAKTAAVTHDEAVLKVLGEILLEMKSLRQFISE